MGDKETKIVIAGFGGQGIVLAGNILARACVIEDKHVAGMASYGVEMRGGTANASVVISDSEIASPFVEKPEIAIILNQQSLDRFEPMVIKGGLIVVDSSMTTRKVKRDDIDVVSIPAADIARWLGNAKVANIIMLGAFIGKTGLLQLANIEKAIEELFVRKKAVLIKINKKALREGAKEGTIQATA